MPSLKVKERREAFSFWLFYVAKWMMIRFRFNEKCKITYDEDDPNLAMCIEFVEHPGSIGMFNSRMEMTCFAHAAQILKATHEGKAKWLCTKFGNLKLGEVFPLLRNDDVDMHHFIHYTFSFGRVHEPISVEERPDLVLRLSHSGIDKNVFLDQTLWDFCFRFKTL